MHENDMKPIHNNDGTTIDFVAVISINRSFLEGLSLDIQRRFVEDAFMAKIDRILKGMTEPL